MADALLTGLKMSGVFAFTGVILAQAAGCLVSGRKTLGEDVRRWHAARQDRAPLAKRIPAYFDGRVHNRGTMAISGVQKPMRSSIEEMFAAWA